MFNSYVKLPEGSFPSQFSQHPSWILLNDLGIMLYLLPICEPWCWHMPEQNSTSFAGFYTPAPWFAYGLYTHDRFVSSCFRSPLEQKICDEKKKPYEVFSISLCIYVHIYIHNMHRTFINILLYSMISPWYHHFCWLTPHVWWFNHKECHHS